MRDEAGAHVAGQSRELVDGRWRRMLPTTNRLLRDSWRNRSRSVITPTGWSWLQHRQVMHVVAQHLQHGFEDELVVLHRDRVADMKRCTGVS
jgi:hypothetical protein